LILSYTNSAFSASVEGRANFRGLDLAARVKVSGSGQLVIDAGGGLVDLGLPIATGHVIFATQAETGYIPVRLEGELVDGEPVALEANTLILLSDVNIGELDPDGKLKDLLVGSFGIPESGVPETLRVLAKIGPAGFALEASIIFPGAGFELFRTCGITATDANPKPCATSAPGITTSLNGKSLTLKFDSSGTFGLKATTNLHLPSQDGTGTGSDLAVSLEASFNPATQSVALALYFTDEWEDALGITGLNLQDVAIQGGLQILPPPAVPIPTIGFGATVNKLPEALNDLLGIQSRSDGTQEKMSLVVNIAPTAPIFAIELGEDDGEIFLKPIQPISAENADVVQIDYAKLVIAPLGGTVGPYTFQPGLSLGFAAIIADVPVDVGATLTLIPPTLKANIDVGAIAFSGLQLSNTHLKLDAALIPPAFVFELDGGMALEAPGSPKFQAHVLVDANITEVKVEAKVDVRDWEIFPNVAALKQASFNIAASASISGTAALSLDGVGKLRVGGATNGTLIDMAGALKLSQTGIDELSLSVAAPLNLPGLAVSGAGCENLPGSTGACTYLAYKRTQSPPFDVGFDGTINVAGRTANLVGKFGATGISLDGDIDLAELGYVDVQGDMWFGSALPANLRVDGPRDITGVNPFTAAPTRLTVRPGNWRLAGSWQATKPTPPVKGADIGGTSGLVSLTPPSTSVNPESTHPFRGSDLSFTAGSVDGTNWLQGRGTLAMPLNGAQQNLGSAMVTISSDRVAVNGKADIPNLGQASFDGILVLGTANPTTFRGRWTDVSSSGEPIESSQQTARAGDFKLTGSFRPTTGVFADSNLQMSIGKLRGTAWFQGAGSLKVDNDPITQVFVQITESQLEVRGKLLVTNPEQTGPNLVDLAVTGTITYKPALAFSLATSVELAELAPVWLPVVLDGPAPIPNLIGRPGSRTGVATTTYVYFALNLRVNVSSTGVSVRGRASGLYVEYDGSFAPFVVPPNGTPRNSAEISDVTWDTATRRACFDYDGSGNAAPVCASL
jgi:hypothetical protein